MISTTPSQTFSFNGAIIEYRPFSLQDVTLQFDEKKLADGSVKISAVLIGCDTLEFTERFGTSFATLLKQKATIFNLFSVAEVIARGLERKTVSGSAMITIDHSHPGTPKALSVCPANKKFFTLAHMKQYADLLGSAAAVGAYAGDATFSIDYDLSRVHRPLEICTRLFRPTLNLRVSIDSWGKPSAWLGLKCDYSGHTLRALADAFRSGTNIGEEAGRYVSALSRFTRSFANEAGYNTLHARLLAAHSAQASLAEFQRFEGAALRSQLSEKGACCVALWSQKEANRYSLPSLGFAPQKRLVRAPSSMTIADLIMLAVELAEEESTGSALPLFEFVGALLAEESGFDLEGTLESHRPLQLRYLDPILI